MAGNTKDERDFCINAFPDLAGDSSFVVTSDCDLLYNCIGFAIGYQDLWVSISRDNIPWFWWPDTAPYDDLQNSLVKTFEYFGFEICSSDNQEADYEKVALYAKDGRWKHAARIIGPNLYHSKLGEAFDIHHRSGDVLNRAQNPNDSYGIPFAFMRRKISDKSLLIVKKPRFGKIIYKGYPIPYMTPSKAEPGLVNYLINKAISRIDNMIKKS